HDLTLDGVVGESTMAALMMAPGRPIREAKGLPPAFGPRRRPERLAADGVPTLPTAAEVPLTPVVPPEWLVPARVRRVVVHWTGGNHRASTEDREHYHLLIEGDGTVVRGRHPVDANDHTGDGVYAAHTRALNTGSIGVAVCCMFRATERPFAPGPFPMTEAQWRRMAEVVAQLCRHYGLPVEPRTVLGHGEVEAVLGVAQRAKWDPLALPWAPDLDRNVVGERFRTAVEGALHVHDEPERPRPLEATVAGKKLRAAAAFDCAVWLPVGGLVEDLGWRLEDADGEGLTLVVGEDRTLYLAVAYPPDEPADPTVTFDSESVLARGFVRAQAVAEGLGLGLVLAEDGRSVALEGTLDGPETTPAGQSVRSVTVGRGDTLATLAARILGDAARWVDILGPDGKPFTRDTARRLQVGQRLLIPADPPEETAPATADEHEPPRAGPELDVLIDALVDLVPSWSRGHARQAVPVLLTACFTHEVRAPAHVGYVLATAEHETNFGRLMEEKWTNSAEQQRYQGRFGNDRPGDGKRYRGRGYVQITFKDNYRKFRDVVPDVDLVAEPERAAEPDIAAALTVVGMRDGRFTTHKLADHLGETDGDFVQARRIVNADLHRTDSWDETGTPRGRRIGNRAKAFTDVLLAHLRR
ncbi:MAG: N-acetylmuramoyl-L-alanine amidase, partial [Pseudomonadota bacterium]